MFQFTTRFFGGSQNENFRCFTAQLGSLDDIFGYRRRSVPFSKVRSMCSAGLLRTGAILLPASTSLPSSSHQVLQASANLLCRTSANLLCRTSSNLLRRSRANLLCCT